jgi:hypothetical protein
MRARRGLPRGDLISGLNGPARTHAVCSSPVKAFSQGDAWPAFGKTSGDVHRSAAPNGRPGLACPWLQPPTLFLLGPCFAAGTDLGSTARVAPICCLGRIVPGTTVELAASEIAPIGLVRPLDTTLDAPSRAPRQLAKGGPTDRCPRAKADPRPPFSLPPGARPRAGPRPAARCL